MSAQVIAALRRRAGELEAAEMPQEVHGPVSGLQKWLAAEFRKLADEAERHGGALEPDKRTGDRQGTGYPPQEEP